jgi:hypothetical protein
MGNEASSSGARANDPLVGVFSHVVDHVVTRRADPAAANTTDATATSTTLLLNLLDEAWAIVAEMSDREIMERIGPPSDEDSGGGAAIAQELISILEGDPSEGGAGGALNSMLGGDGGGGGGDDDDGNDGDSNGTKNAADNTAGAPAAGHADKLTTMQPMPPPIIPHLFLCLRVPSSKIQIVTIRLLRRLFSVTRRNHDAGVFDHPIDEIKRPIQAPLAYAYAVGERFHSWLHEGISERSGRYVKELLISSDQEVLRENLHLMAVLSEHPATRSILVGIDVLTTLVVLLQTNLQDETIILPALSCVANLCHATEQLCSSHQHQDHEVFQGMWKVDVVTTSTASSSPAKGGVASKQTLETTSTTRTILCCRVCAHSCWKDHNPRFQTRMLARCRCMEARGRGTCSHCPNTAGAVLMEQNLLPKLLHVYGVPSVSPMVFEILTRVVLNLCLLFFDPGQTCQAHDCGRSGGGRGGGGTAASIIAGDEKKQLSANSKVGNEKTEGENTQDVGIQVVDPRSLRRRLMSSIPISIATESIDAQPQSRHQGRDEVVPLHCCLLDVLGWLARPPSTDEIERYSRKDDASDEAARTQQGTLPFPLYLRKAAVVSPKLRQLAVLALCQVSGDNGMSSSMLRPLVGGGQSGGGFYAGGNNSVGDDDPDISLHTKNQHTEKARSDSSTSSSLGSSSEGSSDNSEIEQTDENEPDSDLSSDEGEEARDRKRKPTSNGKTKTKPLNTDIKMMNKRGATRARRASVGDFGTANPQSSFNKARDALDSVNSGRSRGSSTITTTTTTIATTTTATRGIRTGEIKTSVFGSDARSSKQAKTKHSRKERRRNSSRRRSRKSGNRRRVSLTVMDDVNTILSHDNNSAVLAAAHDRWRSEGGQNQIFDAQTHGLKDAAKNYDSDVALDPPSISIKVSLDASAKSYAATITFSHPLLPKSGGSPFFQVDSGVMVAFTVNGSDPLWELRDAGILCSTRSSTGSARGGGGTGGRHENKSNLSSLSEGKTVRSNVSSEEAREARGAALRSQLVNHVDMQSRARIHGSNSMANTIILSGKQNTYKWYRTGNCTVKAVAVRYPAYWSGLEDEQMMTKSTLRGQSAVVAKVGFVRSTLEENKKRLRKVQKLAGKIGRMGRIARLVGLVKPDATSPAVGVGTSRKIVSQKMGLASLFTKENDSKSRSSASPLTKATLGRRGSTTDLPATPSLLSVQVPKSDSDSEPNGEPSSSPSSSSSSSSSSSGETDESGDDEDDMNAVPTLVEREAALLKHNPSALDVLEQVILSGYIRDKSQADNKQKAAALPTVIPVRSLPSSWQSRAFASLGMLSFVCHKRGWNVIKRVLTLRLLLKWGTTEPISCDNVSRQYTESENVTDMESLGFSVGDVGEGSASAALLLSTASNQGCFHGERGYGFSTPSLESANKIRREIWEPHNESSSFMSDDEPISDARMQKLVSYGVCLFVHWSVLALSYLLLLTFSLCFSCPPPSIHSSLSLPPSLQVNHSRFPGYGRGYLFGLRVFRNELATSREDVCATTLLAVLFFYGTF